MKKILKKAGDKLPVPDIPIPGLLGKGKKDGEMTSKESTESKETKDEKQARKELEDRQKAAKKRRQEEYIKNRNAIVQGLAQDRVVWHDNFGLDLLFYIKQAHPIIGIFCCHQMHPYGRVNRVVVQVILCAAGYGLSIFCLDEKGNKLDASMDAPVDSQVASYTVTLTLVVVHWLIRHAAMAKCFVEGTGLYSMCGGTAKYCGKATGQLVMFYAMCFAGCCLVAGMTSAEARNIPQDKINETFLYSQLYTAFTGLGFYIAMFVFYWWGCCCCNICTYCCGNGQKSPVKPIRIAALYPYGDEYPNDKKMLWGGDRFGSGYDRDYKYDSESDEPPPPGPDDPIVLDIEQASSPDVVRMEDVSPVVDPQPATQPPLTPASPPLPPISPPLTTQPKDPAPTSAAATPASPGPTDEALGAAEEGRAPESLQPCKNGCGMSAFGAHGTCCTSCKGTSGPHAADCSTKNKRLQEGL